MSETRDKRRKTDLDLFVLALIDGGVSTPYELQKAAGLSQGATILRYAHPTQEHQTKAMDKMEQYISEQKIAHAERIAPQTSHAIQ